MQKIWQIWLWVVLVLCVTVPYLSVQGRDRTRTQRPAAKVFTTAEMVYQLSPFDLVAVSVYGQEDLQCEQLISDKGVLSMPLLGAVPVGGLTVAEAESLVARMLVQQEYLRNPVVNISIREFAPKIVTVLGEVEKPGAVAIPPGRNGIPLLVAVAGAGGFTGTAKLSQVCVTRASRDASTHQKDILDAGKLVNSIESGHSTSVIVHPDDIVFVPKRVF